MEITKQLIEEQKSKYPDCKIAKVTYKGDDEKNVVLEGLVRSPNRQVISEADKFETANPGKAKEIYVRNCVLTDVEKVLADDNLFYQAYIAILDLLPFQKPEVEML